MSIVDPIKYYGSTASGGVSRILKASGYSFSQVLWQTGRGINDSEWNLLQQMYNERIAEVGQQIWIEGFTKKGALDFTGSNNSFLVSPSAVFAQGHMLRVANPDAASEKATVSLPAPPGSGSRTDLVWIEFWFAEVERSGASEAASTAIQKYGGADNSTYTNDLLDGTIAVETTRRVQLRWRYRSVATSTAITDAVVLARGDAAAAIAGKTFTVLANSMGTNTNIYRAGAGNSTDAAVATGFGCIDGYVYALPCFTVARTAGVTAITSPNVTDIRTNGGVITVASPLILTASNSSETPLTIIGAASQTAKLLLFKDSAANIIAAVGPLGQASFGADLSTTAEVLVAGTWAPASATARALALTGTLKPNASSGIAQALYIQPTIDKTNTLTQVAGVYVDNPAISGASAITSAYGVFIKSQTRGATNNYGLYVEAPSAGATDNFSIYSLGNIRLDGILYWGAAASAISDRPGSGSPEGAVTAPPGSTYRDTANGLFYVKRTGTGNTGWKLEGSMQAVICAVRTIADVNSNATRTPVPWDSIITGNDTNTMWAGSAPTHLTAQVEGVYEIDFIGEGDTGNGATPYIYFKRFNSDGTGGMDFGYTSAPQIAGTNFASLRMRRLIYLTVGQYVVVDFNNQNTRHLKTGAVCSANLVATP